MLSIRLLFVGAILFSFSNQCMEVEKYIEIYPRMKVDKIKPERAPYLFGSLTHIQDIIKCLENPELAQERIDTWEERCLVSVLKAQVELFSFVSANNTELFSRIYNNFNNQYKDRLTHGNTFVKTDPAIPTEWVAHMHEALYNTGINVLAANMDNTTDVKDEVGGYIDYSIEDGLELRDMTIDFNISVLKHVIKNISSESASMILRYFTCHQALIFKKGSFRYYPIIKYMQYVKKCEYKEKCKVDRSEFNNYKQKSDELSDRYGRTSHKANMLLLAFQSMQGCCDTMMAYHHFWDYPKIVNSLKVIACFHNILKFHDQRSKLSSHTLIIPNFESLQKFSYEDNVALTEQWIHALQKDYQIGTDPLKFVLGL
jgi:hypothetical protein